MANALSNTAGIDPSTGLYMGKFPASWAPGGQASWNTIAGQTKTTPVGTFTQDPKTGTWTSPSGSKVGDLPGYVGMETQRQAGANLTPYLQAYQNLITNPASVAETPQYKFAMEQGQQAIERGAAAKGMLNSGNVLAELEKYGSGLAGQQVGQQANLLSNALRGAESFGIGSNYYQNAQNISPYWSGGAYISPAIKPSTW